MGYIYLEEQKYNECLSIYQRYIDLARTKSDLENEHIGYHQLAMVYREMNEFQTALFYIEREQKLLKKLLQKILSNLLLTIMSKVIYD